jgi:hypothetical protein
MLRDAFLSDYQLPDVRLNAPPRGLFGDKDGAADLPCFFGPRLT